MTRNEGHQAAWSAGSKDKVSKWRFDSIFKDLDKMSTADFYLRMENKPPQNKENTTRLTGLSLKWPTDLYIGFETIS